MSTVRRKRGANLIFAAVGVAAAVYYVCMCGRLDPARAAAMTTPAEPETPETDTET